MRTLFKIWIVLGLSCATIPSWVKGPFSYEDGVYFYAKGFNPPTLFPHDAEKYACDNAVLEIARYIKIEIKADQVQVIRTSGIQQTAENILIIVSKGEIKNEVSGIEKVASWYNQEEKKGLPKGGYCLLRIKKDKLPVK